MTQTTTTARSISSQGSFEQILGRCQCECLEFSQPVPNTKTYYFADGSKLTLNYSLITCIARPLNDQEPDLLAGNEHKTLSIVDEDKITLYQFTAPRPNGWTLEILEFFLRHRPLDPNRAFDAYLGSQWIGSTEV